jgi:DNA invertase Pin-like site-specific DNA recombinase
MAEEIPRTAVIYRRVSRDKEGLSVAVERQEYDCRALATRLGLTVEHVYTDNDLGASKHSKKPRPEFEQMLDVIRSGGIDIVLAYSASRLTRHMGEFEELVKLHEKTGVLYKTVVSGDDDLGTADGLMVARFKAAAAAAEAHRTSERLIAAHVHMARNGKPFTGGARGFGWEADKMTLVPSEAELIKRSAVAFINGASFNAIAASWNSLGVPTPRGNEWRHVTVKEVLASPRLAGYRIYKGNTVRNDAGELVKGEWETILDEDTYNQLAVAIEDRKRSRRRASSYLLTPILMCGVCGAKMYGNRRKGGETFYRCSRAWHLTVNAEKLEHAVSTEVGLRLGQISRYTIKHGVSEAPKATEFPGIERLATLQTMNEELMQAYNSGALKADRAFPQIQVNDDEIETLLSEQRRWNVEAKKASAPKMNLGEFDISGWFGVFTQEVRNNITVTACDRVVVKPTGKTRHLSTRERLNIQWNSTVTPWDNEEEAPAINKWDQQWLDDHENGLEKQRKKAAAASNLNQVAVAALLKEQPSIVGREVAEQLGISRPYAQTLMRRVRASDEEMTERERSALAVKVD